MHSAMRSSRLLTMVAAAAMLPGLAIACGGDDEAPTDDATPRATNTISGGGATTAPTEKDETPEATGAADSGGVVELEITSDALKFDKDTLTATAGSQVALSLVNKEAVPHNLSIYEDDSASVALYTGDLATADTVVYEFEAPAEPGTYFFRCDIHPADMVGDFIVQ